MVILVTSRITGRGGRETVISRLLPEISRRGTRVLLAMLDNADDPAWAASLPPVLRIASIDPAVAIKRHLIATIRFIRDTLRASGADVVVATEPLAFPIIRLASLWLGSRRPAILSWFHADIRFLRHTWAVRFCDGHLAISEGIADQVKHRWRQPISVIYNPFDADDIQPCPRPARDSDVHLLFIGRLHEQKCADRILTALSKVRATNWRLQIVGDGPELGQLRLLADTLQLSHRIIWSGWSVAPWACVESASLLLLTSRMEGFPLVLVEALARGVPLAAMDCDFGPREVIQRGRNGWLLPQGDVESLARLIDSLCNGEIQLPPEASVIATVERFRVSTVVSSFLKAANEACGRLA